MDHPTAPLFGRENELAEAALALATAATGTPQALLVGGDAGIGKTSFAAAVTGLALDRGFLAMTGHCLDIESGEPLAPLREALRAALSGRDRDDAARRSRSGSRPTSRATAPSPRQASSRTCGSRWPSSRASGRCCWCSRTCTGRTARRSDFAAGAGPDRDRAASLLVLTFRSDELIRRHPFRKTLARDRPEPSGPDRIDLAPLDRDAIAGIVGAHDGPTDPSVVGALLARSEGNPLYAEELLAPEPTGVPVTSQRSAAGPDRRRCGAGPAALLRLASVNGSRLDLDRSLRASAGLERGPRWTPACGRLSTPTCCAAADEPRRVPARAAARGGVRRPAPERARSCARPARRRRWPTSRDPIRRAASPAWPSTGTPPTTSRTPSRPGSARVSRWPGRAHPEALAHLERALEMWDHVEDPGRRQGLTKSDVLCQMAKAAKVADGHEDRAMRFMREALALLDPEQDRLRASRIYSTYAELCHELADATGHAEAVRLALELAEGEASEELARALIAMTGVHVRHDELDAAADTIDRAVEVARATRAARGAGRGPGGAGRGRPSHAVGCGRCGASSTRRSRPPSRAGLTSLALRVTEACRPSPTWSSGRIEEGEALSARTRERAAGARPRRRGGVRRGADRRAVDQPGPLRRRGAPARGAAAGHEAEPVARRAHLVAAGPRRPRGAPNPSRRRQLAVWAEVVVAPDGFTVMRLARLFCGLDRVADSARVRRRHLATSKDGAAPEENCFAARARRHRARGRAP